MRERPILFSGPMVRALLAGTKTQTRRVVKDAPEAATKLRLSHGSGGYLQSFIGELIDAPETDPEAWRQVIGEHGCETPVRCPYGQPGDHLWVRETVAIERWTREFGDEPPLPKDRPHRHVKHEHPDGDDEWWLFPHYRATDPAPDLCCERDNCRTCDAGYPRPHWTPSIHMPRWASRILLEITDVRVQRLNELSEEDAKAEGAECGVATLDLGEQRARRLAELAGSGLRDHRLGFAWLWESINGAGSWDANPWVWALTFKRVEAAHV